MNRRRYIKKLEQTKQDIYWHLCYEHRTRQISADSPLRLLAVFEQFQKEIEIQLSYLEAEDGL